MPDQNPPCLPAGDMHKLLRFRRKYSKTGHRLVTTVEMPEFLVRQRCLERNWSQGQLAKQPAGGEADNKKATAKRASGCA